MPKAKEFTFIFNTYVPPNGKEYLDINLISPKIYAKAFILVKNWNKLEGNKRIKGVGYLGAELKKAVY